MLRRDGIEKIAENLEKKPDAAKIAGVDNLREENPYGSGAESKKVKSERNEPESPAFYTDNGSSIKTQGNFMSGSKIQARQRADTLKAKIRTTSSTSQIANT